MGVEGVCKNSRVLTSLFWQSLFFLDQCAQGDIKNPGVVTALVELALCGALEWHNGSAGKEHSRGLEAAAALVFMMPAPLQ